MLSKPFILKSILVLGLVASLFFMNFILFSITILAAIGYAIYSAYQKKTTKLLSTPLVIEQPQAQEADNVEVKIVEEQQESPQEADQERPCETNLITPNNPFEPLSVRVARNINHRKTIASLPQAFVSRADFVKQTMGTGWMRTPQSMQAIN